MKRLGQDDMLGSLAEELGRRRVSEVRESSGRLPPNAKYWFPSEGMVAASALRLLYMCVCVCVSESLLITDNVSLNTALPLMHLFISNLLMQIHKEPHHLIGKQRYQNIQRATQLISHVRI